MVMRSVDRAFYNTKEWKRCRALYVQKVNGFCERCKAKGFLVPGDIVHHKIHLTEANYRDPRISLSFDNLELLCTACHNAEHFGEEKIRRWSFEDGELQTYDDNRG